MLIISNISIKFVTTTLKLKGWEPKYEDVINYKKKMKEEQKKRLIEMMYADENLELYDSYRSIYGSTGYQCDSSYNYR